jgi:sugar phosphate isomerase/epimerase
MRISVWSWFLCGMTPEDVVTTFVKHGFECTELSSEHGNELLERGDAVRTGTKLKAFGADHGFSFPQAHFDLATDICQPSGSKERQAVMDSMKRWCDLFAALDVRAGVLHPGGERLWEMGWERADTLKCSAEVLHELLEHVADSPTKLCLENSWHHEDTMHLVDTIASPDLCVCMDTGHLNLTGGSWPEFTKWAGKRLKALHIADNLGSNDDHILPFGPGTIKWDGFADALKDVGYEGLFNFEVGGETRYRPLDVRLAKLDYVRRLALIMLGEELEENRK